MEKIKVEQHSVTGLSWASGWLFTVGFLHLPILKAILAIALWPYYLGTAFS